MSSGRAFHKVGALWENALYPYLLRLQLGTIKQKNRKYQGLCRGSSLPRSTVRSQGIVQRNSHQQSQSLVILDLSLRKTRSGKSRDYHDTIVFEKIHFQNVIRPGKEKAAFSNSTGLSKRVFDTRTATGWEHFTCYDRIVSQNFILLTSNGEKIPSNMNVVLWGQI